MLSMVAPLRTITGHALSLSLSTEPAELSTGGRDAAKKKPALRGQAGFCNSRGIGALGGGGVEDRADTL